MRLFLSFLFVSVLVAGACSDGATSTTAGPPDETTAVATTATTVTAAPSTTSAPSATTVVSATTTAGSPNATSGVPSATCINGWETPAPGTSLRTQPLDMIRWYLGLDAEDRFIVETMRFFRGPEDVEIMAPRGEVGRWYVEAHLQADPEVAGRWIVAGSAGGDGDEWGGVRAEAAAGTVGFEPGMWTSWTGDEGEPRRGEPIDTFNPPCTAEHGPYCQCNWGVDGCSCSNDERLACTGIPPTVMGCLNGL